MTLLDLDPVPTLLQRLRDEYGSSFAGKSVRVSRAPGRLDVMGGIADYTGSLVCEMPLAEACAAVVARRDDRKLVAYSLNLADQNRPFRLELSIDALAKMDAATLAGELAQPGREWAGYVVGCLFLLGEKGLVDWAQVPGLDIAVYSTVPSGGGVSSSAAIEVATMMNLAHELNIGELQRDGMRIAALCQEVENRIVGAPCGVMDQVASCLGEAGTLMRLKCQPHELLDPLPMPAGVKAVGINTNVKHSVGGGAYGKTRTAAFIGHTLIVEQMRKLGEQAGKTMSADPTAGYLANLDPDDYKAIFRPVLPETLTGDAFLQQHDSHGDPVTTIDPAVAYHIQFACDHHVLEAQRVRRFCEFLECASGDSREKNLRAAGHLMYASHKSYTDKAGLGAPEADLLVDLVKQHEAAGLYGAKITGGGSGGTVAVLTSDTDDATAAVRKILADYAAKTELTPELLDGSSPGAFHVGTAEGKI